MKKRIFWVFGTAMSTLLGMACHKIEGERPHMPDPCLEIERHQFADSAFHIGEPGSMEFGLATARKLDKPWTASVKVADNDSCLFFTFSTFPSVDFENGRFYENLYFDRINKQEDCFVLQGKDDVSSFAFYRLTDLDVGYGQWILFEEDGLGNKLEIIRLTKDSVFGRFAVSFVDTSSYAGKGQPEYLRFYNGQFEAELLR